MNKHIFNILNEDDVILLFKQLENLKEKFDNYTLNKYKRINPFIENLVDWKEKGNRLYPGKNITIYDSSTIIGDVDIGINCWVGPFTILDGSGGLIIGENCSISTGVNIYTHDSVKWALSGGKLNYEYEKVYIENNCFIGAGATICKGVKIGKHCLVGAGAVVTTSIPDYSIALGIPAKVKGRVEIESNSINFLYDAK